MALAEGTNKIQYTVSTATTDYDFPYKYWESADLVVTVVDLSTGLETTLDLGAGDYAVTPTNGDTALGATITTVTAYDNHRITILREIAVESEADFVRGDGLPPDALNSEFDKAAARAQQLDGDIGTQLSHPNSDPAGLNYEAPTVESRKNKVTAWDTDGNVTAVDLASSGTIGVDATKGLEINANIIAGNVDDTTIGFDGAGQFKVKDGGIDTLQLADNAVETAKIADSNVTKAKIENVADMTALGNTSGSVAAPQEVVILDEDDMVSDSATSLVTQQSVKAYVDAQAPSFAMKYSGATEFGPAAMPTSYTDLDLSSTVGVNRAFVHLSIATDVSANISFKPADEVLDLTTSGAGPGWGASGMEVSTGKIGYLSLVTDASGVVKWLSNLAGSGGTVVKVVAYQVLQ